MGRGGGSTAGVRVPLLGRAAPGREGLLGVSAQAVGFVLGIWLQISATSNDPGPAH